MGSHTVQTQTFVTEKKVISTQLSTRHILTTARLKYFLLKIVLLIYFIWKIMKKINHFIPDAPLEEMMQLIMTTNGRINTALSRIIYYEK